MPSRKAEESNGGASKGWPPKVFNVRTGAAWNKRAAALISKLTDDADLVAFAGGEIGLGDVYRLVVERGLRSLEEQYGLRGSKTGATLPSEAPASTHHHHTGGADLGE